MHAPNLVQKFEFCNKGDEAVDRTNVPLKGEHYAEFQEGNLLIVHQNRSLLVMKGITVN